MGSDKQSRPESVRRLLSNAGWLALEPIIANAIGVVASVLMARHLGPDEFGIWSYAIALITMGVTVSSLGIEPVVVRDIVKRPEQENVLLTTSFALRMVMSCLLISVALVFSRIVETSSPKLSWLLSILALGLLLTSFEAEQARFRAHRSFRSMALIRILSALGGGGGKVVLALVGVGLTTFVWAQLGQMILLGAGFALVARMQGRRLRGKDLRWDSTKELLRHAVPLLISALSVMLYLRSDIVMIAVISDERAVGVYAVASRISALVYVLPVIASTLVSPSLFRLHESEPVLFRARMRQLLAGTTIVLSAAAVAITLLAPWGIPLLFGERYADSVDVLVIHVWSGVFVGHGVMAGIWLLAEKRTVAMMIRTLAGGVVNVALNAVLIPTYGPIGAAAAMVVACIVASFGTHLFLGPLGRTIAVEQLRAFAFVELITGRLRTAR